MRTRRMLHLVVLMAFLLSGIAVAPAHAHHGVLDRDHPCSMCQLAAAPVDLPGAGGVGSATPLAPESTHFTCSPDAGRRAEQPAHSSHPLRGPPSR